MKKQLTFVLTLAALTAMTAITAFAGTWRTGVSHPDRWWYDNGDGTFASNGWHWIDGNNDGISECYYFDAEGWMYANTTTPDGYQVDSNGAWIQNGAVQTKTAEVNTQATNQTSTEQASVQQQSSGGDLTNAATFAGTYTGGKDYSGMPVTAIVTPLADGGASINVILAGGSSFTDVYHYSMTNEQRGVVWTFETAGEKGSMVVIDANTIDIGYGPMHR